MAEITVYVEIYVEVANPTQAEVLEAARWVMTELRRAGHEAALVGTEIKPD